MSSLTFALPHSGATSMNFCSIRSVDMTRNADVDTDIVTRSVRIHRVVDCKDFVVCIGRSVIGASCWSTSFSTVLAHIAVDAEVPVNYRNTSSLGVVAESYMRAEVGARLLASEPIGLCILYSGPLFCVFGPAV